MTITDTTLPAGFTKRSGRQIVTIAAMNGWVYEPTEQTDWSAEMRFRFPTELPVGKESRGIPVTVTVGVSPTSGAFLYAKGIVDAAGDVVYRIDTDSLGGVLDIFRQPAYFLRSLSEQKAQEVLDEQRSAAAVVAKAGYVASPEYARDRFYRDAVAGLVDAPSEMTLEFKGWAGSLVSQTEDFLVAQYLKQFAQGTLELEGTVREWCASDSAEVKQVWTLDEAAKRMLLYSTGSNDATDPRTAVAFAKAQREFAWKSGAR